ncbi:hypothetical protein OG609_04175 [Streptomyces sp. NBC_01224]|uniref:hypothetical protein n=1 Tax=unclassified Streptomyces TaxID=2593676 RepID=UPI002E0E857D|nr:hypothetical protein OG609_04175 [Streptomyces sp. NBC_01224]
MSAEAFPAVGHAMGTPSSPREGEGEPRLREDVMTAGTGLRVYPEPADVFVADQVELARHLHPLISIDLAQVNPAWHGWIHLVSPLEPAEGYIGDHTQAFHSALQTTNWLGFAMDGDRYRLLGDVRYFARAATPEEVPELWEGFRARLDEHCERQERSYQAHRDTFRCEGELLRLDDEGSPLYGTRDPVALLDQLGGRADAHSNWVDPDLFHLEYDDDHAWPISPAGNRFQFVAAVPGWHYRRSGADQILLFFEPVDRLALLTFDWS